MNAQSEHLYQQIGQKMVDVIGEPFSKGYARVEMANDFGSVGLFADRGDGVYHYLTDDSGDLFNLFFRLRELSIDSGLGAWSQATYALDGDGRFSIEFGYDNISDPGAGMDRRKARIEQVLGRDAAIRWS